MATARIFVVGYGRKRSTIEDLETSKNRMSVQNPADKEPREKCVYCGDTECDRHPQENSKFVSSMALRVGGKRAMNNDGPAGEDPRPRCPYCGDSDCDRHEPEVGDECPGHGGSAGE